MYLTTKTCPDFAQIVEFGSRYLNNHTRQNVIEMKWMFRYLNGIKDQVLGYNYKHNETEVVAYYDSNYAGDIDTRKSTTGCVIFYCDGLIMVFKKTIHSSNIKHQDGM